mmetsp:Transcript_15902/g.36665  ORF Transcript_15902/g.36665 Transcript_15902/m.36665 type:complete len:258 (+) Transcript_15902:73-846(+)
MKFLAPTTSAYFFLMVQSLSIQCQAEEEYRPIYSKLGYAVYEICALITAQEECIGIDFYDPLQSCQWDYSRDECYMQQDEDLCEFLDYSPESCDKSSGCAWVRPSGDDRPGLGHCVSYKEISQGGCVYNYASGKDHTVTDKDKCNDIKGCAWYKGDSNKKQCQPTPSSLSCDKFGDKKKCKNNGCGWSNKSKQCVGVWENRFLSYLVGKEAEFAKKAIAMEYGDSYYVRIEEPEALDPERITLVVDDNGVVKKPLIG